MIASLLLLAGAMALSAGEPNVLTPEEKAGGWRLLFDGKNVDAWRGFGQNAFPKQGWVVEDGCLKKVEKVRGGDIITREEFDDFEFQWEWRIRPKGNNGVKYFIDEKRGGIGHEYQLIDEVLAKGKSSTASFYEVLPPAADKPLNKPGEWNHSRILVQGNHVEHWLNGVKVLEYTPGSEPVKAGVARSKFKNVPKFGEKIRGHILLTDHNDEAWFRNLKVRVPQEKR